MPLTLELLHSPPAADREDLLRVLADADIPDAGTRLQRWLQAQEGPGGDHLWGGRFNGRLLALAWVAEEAAGGWRLDALHVRALTRRRGVARQLLTLLLREAASAGRPLRVPDRGEWSVLVPLWRELGFVPTSEAWVRDPE